MTNEVKPDAHGMANKAKYGIPLASKVAPFIGRIEDETDTGRHFMLPFL